MNEKFPEDCERTLRVKFYWIGLIIALVAFTVLGARLRFTELGEKPMHHDEAEQAFTLGKLLDGDGYRYTKDEHHGPTLYYMTAWFLRATGRDSLASVDSAAVRTIPAVFGVALILVPLLWIRRRSTTLSGIPFAATLAVTLGASSPSAVYYSRYFVQETIFVACFWAAIPLLWHAIAGNGRTRRTRSRVGLAVAAGLLFGVAVASKETWVLMLSATVGGVLTVFAAERLPVFRRICIEQTDTANDADNADAESTANAEAERTLPVARWVGIGVGFAIAAGLVAGLFFSSFGANPQGIADSVLTYGSYFGKAFESSHVKPFGWYAETFFTAHKYGKIHFVLEIFALGGAILLVPLLFVKRLWTQAEWRIGSFSVVSGTGLLLVYSLLSYKTPWLVLGILPPLWMAGGLAIAGIWRLFARIPQRWASIGAILVVLCGINAAVKKQEKSAKFLTSPRFSAHEHNPLAYVHSTHDIREIEDIATRIGNFAPAQTDPVFAFVFSQEYGAFFWALRSWKAGWTFDRGGRVWLARNASGTVFPAGLPPPPIIITDEQNEPLVAAHLPAKYAVMTEVLRPGFTVQLRIREDLVEKSARAETTSE